MICFGAIKLNIHNVAGWLKYQLIRPQTIKYQLMRCSDFLLNLKLEDRDILYFNLKFVAVIQIRNIVNTQRFS